MMAQIDYKILAEYNSQDLTKDVSELVSKLKEVDVLMNKLKDSKINVTLETIEVKKRNNWFLKLKHKLKFNPRDSIKYNLKKIFGI